MRMDGNTIFITGGTSGIGEATAILFAKEAASIAITGRDEKRGDAVTEKILSSGGKAIFIRTDVRKAGECRRAVDETVGAFGQLDILFNNAGVFYPHTILDCTEEEWDLCIDSFLKGSFNCMSRCDNEIQVRKVLFQLEVKRCHQFLFSFVGTSSRNYGTAYFCGPCRCPGRRFRIEL